MAAADPRQALLAVFDRLDPAQQRRLLAFAGALADRGAAVRRAVATQAADETVVMAIRRLGRSHVLSDRRRVMSRAAMLLGQHALHGRAASEVIAELEVLFEQHRDPGGSGA